MALFFYTDERPERVGGLGSVQQQQNGVPFCFETDSTMKRGGKEQANYQQYYRKETTKAKGGRTNPLPLQNLVLKKIQIINSEKQKKMAEKRREREREGNLEMNVSL